MKKNVMKRAWEIYRTLVGDHVAKLAMALRMAWAEAKTESKDFYQIACEAIHKVENGADFVTTVRDTAKRIFNMLNITTPYIRYTYGTALATEQGMEKLTRDLPTDRFDAGVIYDMILGGWEEKGLTCLSFEGATERIRKPRARHFTYALAKGAEEAERYANM